MPLENEFKVIADSFAYQPSSAWVYTDKTLLRRVVQNFLTNAVRYGEGGKILLGIRRSGQMLRIEVWVSGPGIEADKLEVIFNEFERLGHGSEKPGLGLGLAICDRIAKLLSAKIEVKSTPGKGSCFAIELPRIKAALPVIKSEPIDSDNLSAPESKQVIVVIDNDPLVLTAMTSLLSEWGYVVYSGAAEDALEGIEGIETQPDLILADYHLHQTNGVDLVAGLLVQKQWQVPCIINSADSSEEVREHTINAGYSFIGKPLKALALKRLMRRLMG